MASCSRIPVFRSDLIIILTLGELLHWVCPKNNGAKAIVEIYKVVIKFLIARFGDAQFTMEKNDDKPQKIITWACMGINYGRILRANLIKFNNFCHHNISILWMFEAGSKYLRGEKFDFLL